MFDDNIPNVSFPHEIIKFKSNIKLPSWVKLATLLLQNFVSNASPEQNPVSTVSISTFPYNRFHEFDFKKQENSFHKNVCCIFDSCKFKSDKKFTERVCLEL